MLEVSEVGNTVSKEDYKVAIPDLRVGLINAQYDLRDADFPVIIWIATSAGILITPPPRLDETLWQLVFAMLDMGGLRTFEKIKGVAR